MNSISSESLEKIIVSAIQRGAKNAKIAKESNGDEIDNAEPFKKVDKIVNSLKQKFDELDEFETYILFRGRYQILLVYNNRKNELYSFMGQERLKNLLTSKAIKDKQNYLFGLLLFNDGQEIERQQQIIGSEFEFVSEINQKVNEKVKNLIEKQNVKYITITYNCYGYVITSVKKLFISKYSEIVEEKDLSEYINMVDYEETYQVPKVDVIDKVDQMDFSMKEEFIINKDNLEDLKVEFNRNDKEEKNNEK